MEKKAPQVESIESSREASIAIVTMDVMHVRHVRMRVPEQPVLMEMRVGLAGRFRSAMGVLVMLVMQVGMGMSHRLVNVLVRMSFGKVEPNAQAHEAAGRHQLG